MTRDQIKTAWENGKTVIVKEGERYRDFSRWHIGHIDSSDYPTQQTSHELIVIWRPKL